MGPDGPVAQVERLVVDEQPDELAVGDVDDRLAGLRVAVPGLGVRERSLDFFLHELAGIPTAATVAASLIGFLFNLFWGLVGGLAILTARRSNPSDTPVHPDESADV